MTRDNINLATDIYLPISGKGPWPVIIERTPYNKDAPSRSEVNLNGRKLSRKDMANAFTEEGFVVIFQDCRGRHGSTGEFVKYVNEANDGYDTFAWIMQQNWCNGDIGTMGLSYAAHTQMALACLAPAGLKCMLMDSGGFSSAYQCGIRQSGAFELKQATWAYRQALNSPEANADPILKKALEQEDIIEWFKRMPWSKGNSPLKHLPAYEEYLLQQWSKGSFDDFWKQSGIYALDHYQSIPDIPILFMSSWYDAYVKSTLDNYTALRAIKKAPMSLIMGPWLHGDRNNTFSGAVEFGQKASFDHNLAPNWLEYRLDWFKQWLTPQNKLQNDIHFNSKDVIHIFQMGGGSGKRNQNNRLQHGGEWLTSTEWPFPNTQKLQLYLRDSGYLSVNKAPLNNLKLSYFSNPEQPVPTIGGALTSGAPVFLGGAFDQRESAHFFGSTLNNRPLSERSDVLVFQSDILEEDITLCGDINVHLFIESDAPDTDFTVKLIDVYPANEDYLEGFAMNITDGIFRCRYRKSWEKPTNLIKEEITKIVITPFASCNLFKKGHRIRLDIASSNFPKYDVNPNSGEPEGQATLKRTACNTIHLNKTHASYIEFDFIDNEHLTTLKKDQI